MKDYLIFMYVAKLSVLTPFIVYFFLKQKKDHLIRIVLLLAGVSIVTEIIVEMTIQKSIKTTLPQNLFYIIQFVIISYCYRFHLLVGKYTKLINGATLLFLAFFAAVTLFNNAQPIHAPQNWVWTVGNMVIVIYCVLHYFYLRKTLEREPPIHTYGALWITIAFLTYFTYSLGPFILGNYVFGGKLEQDTAFTIWNFHNFYYVIKNLLLSYAMYRISKEKVRVQFPFEKYGEEEDWWKRMRPNPTKNKERRDTSEKPNKE